MIYSPNRDIEPIRASALEWHSRLSASMYGSDPDVRAETEVIHNRWTDASLFTYMSNQGMRWDGQKWRDQWREDETRSQIAQYGSVQSSLMWGDGY